MSHSPGKRAAKVSIPNFLRRLSFAFWAMTLFVAGTASAAVDLRIDGHTSPINVFATVTTSGGAPITGLGSGAFTVTLDGSPVSPTVTPVNGVVSVVFAMDYSGSVTSNKLEAMQDAVEAFITAMQPGEYAAIVKFNASNPNHASVVKPFTLIDDVDTALIAAAQSPYPDPGTGTNIFDALVLSIQQFSGASLPSGPKAVILVSDGVDNASTADINDVITAATTHGIPIFTVDIGGFTSGPGVNTMKALSTQSGGDYYYAPDNATIGTAYQQLDARLNNEYKLTFPASLTGCADHTVQVQVTGQTSAGQDFAHCIAVYVPDLVGLTSAAAVNEVSAWQTAYSSSSGFNLTYGTETPQSSLTVPVGSVISQTPPLGTQVTANLTINVAVSTGPAPATVPNVVGLTQLAATTAITGANLVVGTITQQSSSTVAAGIVISQTPAAAASGHLEGDSVDLVVSTGVSVPNVVGNTQAAATTAITNASLAVGTVTQQSSTTVVSGSVISQTPTAGTSVASGSSVNLVVSSGAPASPPATPPASGGGGATGPFELLFALGLVVLAWRRRTATR